jgi:eukaryotic-like serine/threonine-protein kinase
VIGLGTTLNQRFTLEKELGRGGMGAVYRATDQILQRSVAIKVLKEAGDEVGPRIRLEAQILARLLHESVVRLYDFGESEGLYFLVMEEVDGTSFSKRWRILPLADRLRIIAQVADALNYAHHQGVIHRDVKPANVLLTASDQAKLSDFGLSMLAEAKDDSGTIRGTPHYMSPEQARGKRLDHRTDLYSLGVMLYECATGKVPFLGQAMSVIAQHTSATPTPPRFKNPDVSPTLETLILGLLAKNPDERPVSGDVVAQVLRAEAEQARLLGSVATPGPDVAGPSIDGVSATIARGLQDTASIVSAPPSAPASMPAPAPAPAPVPAAGVLKVASPLAREMLEAVLAEPLMLSADERYLCGHYLAYLLGGSRRKGILLLRPLDPRNADRARLMLAMTWLIAAGPGEENANVARAAELLDKRPDIRPALNPVVVMKYLASRDTPAKRKRFRQARKLLQDASKYAQKSMVDVNGVLNPGLMPQNLEDLRRIAPARSEVDDQLVSRWNRVSDVWRENADFRTSVLAYATRSAHHDPASADLWPEVVYPLIERARWQREFRPKHEQLWDYLTAKVLHVPDAGVRLDRMIVKSVPVQVAEQIEEGLVAFVDDPRLEDDDPAAAAEGDDRLTTRISGDVSLHDLTADADTRDRGLVRLAPPEPYRFTQGDLRDLWSEAVATLGKPGATRRAAPVGPYRLAVIPSIRGRSAGQFALQGMPNKQIELLTPSIRAGGSSGKPVIAIWIYQDASAAIVYLDFKGNEKYILWHAPNGQQINYEGGGDLSHMLYTLGMEMPDQLDSVLSKRFRPRSKA